jgi:hypothetical protein
MPGGQDPAFVNNDTATNPSDRFDLDGEAHNGPRASISGGGFGTVDDHRQDVGGWRLHALRQPSLTLGRAHEKCRQKTASLPQLPMHDFPQAMQLAAVYGGA